MYTWGLSCSSHEEIPLLAFNLGELDPIINMSVVVQVTHIVTYTSVPSDLASGGEQAHQHRWHLCHSPPWTISSKGNRLVYSSHYNH